MSEVESRALRRAALALLVLSVARWVAARPAGPAGHAAPEAVAEHAGAVRAAAEEGARRARPLGADERIDPNRAPEEELDRLPGVGPATARAIVEAREAGAVFRRPEDLAAVPGIGPATVEKLRSSIDTGSPPPGRASRRAAEARSGPGGAVERDRVAVSGPGRNRAAFEQVDLNRAGVDEMVRLPGIGPVLAARIVEERRRSAFVSLDDLVRVPGVGPATVERLRGRAVVR